MRGYVLIERGDLFNLAKKMVSVIHKELEGKVGKVKYKKLGVMQPRIKNKTEPQLLNKPLHPGSVRRKFYSRNRLLTVVIDKYRQCIIYYIIKSVIHAF